MFGDSERVEENVVLWTESETPADLGHVSRDVQPVDPRRASRWRKKPFIAVTLFGRKINVTTKNLNSPVDTQTHTCSAFHNCVTFTFDLLTSRFARAKFGVDSSSRFAFRHTNPPTHKVTGATDHLTHGSTIAGVGKQCHAPQSSEALILLSCRLAHLSVCVCACLSVRLSVRKVYCGKMADWIRMPFGIVSGSVDGWVY